MTDTCALCHAWAARDLLAQSALSAAFHDAFPLAEGHALVIPKRHVAKLAELTPEEGADLFDLGLRHLREMTARDGCDFTVGVNDGPTAGQTVPHVHLHIIPRALGDVPDPRGGIRWVMPQRAAYWESDD